MSNTRLDHPGTWGERLQQRASNVPVPLYGGALALLGLCLLLPAIWPWSRDLAGMSLLYAAGVASLVAAIAVHLAKAWLATDSFRRDLSDPAVAPFLGQLSVALALLAELQQRHSPATHQLALWACAALTALTLLHVPWLIARHRLTWRDASPSWLLPPIQWLYLGLLAHDRWTGLRYASVILGTTGAMLAIACLSMRLLRRPPLPQPSKPALSITVAIPSLGLLAALQMQGDPGLLAAALFSLTLTTYLIAVASMARACGRRFHIAWWAYGMPLSAAALAFSEFARRTGNPWLHLWAQATGMVALVVTAFLSLLALRAVVRFLQTHPGMAK